MSAQPKWKCIAKLGDVNPLYGGYYVFQDESGVYTPEAEYVVCVDEENERGPYHVYRFILDRCTYVNGVLSDNRYHPDHAAWFARPESERATRPQDTTYLSNVARSTGLSVEVLISCLTSDDPIQRAHAYRDIGEYHGFENLDCCPLVLSADEVSARYRWL